MATKRNNLFLYLTLACFLGIILIFVFDGYIGIYDDLVVTSGEREERVDAEVWMREDPYRSTSVEWGEKAFFRYEVDNRRFSAYTADIEVSLWHSQKKVADLAAMQLLLGSFGKGQIEWVLDTAELVPADIPPELGYDFTVVIKRGDIERSLVTHVRPMPYPQKAVIPIFARRASSSTVRPGRPEDSISSG